MIIKNDGKIHILIDSNANYELKRKMLAHELSHFFTNTICNLDSTTVEILIAEEQANKFMKEVFGIEK